MPSNTKPRHLPLIRAKQTSNILCIAGRWWKMGCALNSANGIHWSKHNQIISIMASMYPRWIHLQVSRVNDNLMQSIIASHRNHWDEFTRFTKAEFWIQKDQTVYEVIGWKMIPWQPQSLTLVVQSHMRLDEVCTKRIDLTFQKKLGVLACKKKKRTCSDPSVLRSQCALQ